jgi:hypothetical protein
VTAVALVLAVAAVVLAAGYLLTGGDRLLIGSSSASLATAAVTGVVAWRYRASGRRLQAATALAAVAELEQAHGRIAAQLEQISARLSRVEQLVTDRLDRVVQRVAAAEEHAVDIAMLRGIAAWAARVDQRLGEIQQAAQSNGKPANGRQPSGLDAEVIQLARRISDKIQDS